MAAKIETLSAPSYVTPTGSVWRTARRMLRATGDWFRDGQLGPSSERYLSRATGGRV